MKHSSLATIVAVAALLLTGLAHADVLYRGKVYQTTADHIITRDNLVCTYGPWESDTLATGATVLSRSKTCTGASNGR